MEMSTLVHIGNATILKSLHLGIAIAQCYTLHFEYVPRNPISPNKYQGNICKPKCGKIGMAAP